MRKIAVEAAICLGGDSDTTGAITGALAGASLGASRIPPDLLAGLVAWPRTVARMRALAIALEHRRTGDREHSYVPPFWASCGLRNALLLAAVLGHGFRRLLPPY